MNNGLLTQQPHPPGMPLGLQSQRAALTMPYDISSADPFFPYVSFLLRCRGTEGSRILVDESLSRLPITQVGSPRITSSQALRNPGCLELEGSGSYLSLPDASAFEFLAADFTVEAWMMIRRHFSDPIIVGQWGNSTATQAWLFNYQTPADLSRTELQFAYTTGVATFRVYTVATPLPTMRWLHLAACRSGASLRMFVNGVQIGTTFNSSTDTIRTAPTNAVLIGHKTDSPSFVNGFIDSVRVTKGVARYQSNFSPPVWPFPAQ